MLFKYHIKYFNLMTNRKSIAKNVLKCYNQIDNVFLIFQKGKLIE